MVFRELSPKTQTQARTNLEQFLELQLVPDTTVMLPVAQLTEVLNIPVGQIVPIPQMPSWVMGVYNWRGEILWIVDLGELVGLTPWHQKPLTSPVHRAVVLKSSSQKSSNSQSSRQTIGLVVNQVKEMAWCDPEQIQSPPGSAITPSLASFLQGYWLNPQGEMFIVLQGKAIMAAMPKS